MLILFCVNFFQRSFSETISKCLLLSTKPPILSAQEHDNVRKVRYNLTQLLGEETINRFLSERIDEIIVSLVKFVYDPDCVQDILCDLDVEFLEPESMHYSYEMLSSMFEYLQVFLF